MEREQGAEREREATTVARSQNTVYVLPQDAAAMRQFLAPALERLDRGAAELQLLVIASDAESAVAMARAAAQTPAGEALRIVPVTGATRAQRLLHILRPQVVMGAPGDLLALIRGSALKLDQLRGIIFAWADQVVAAGGAEALESLMAEVPKETARTVVATRLTSDVEGLIERYARRAGRRGAAGEHEGAAAPTELRYVAVTAASRPGALRRVLDDLDPESAAIYARTEEGERQAREELRALGLEESGIVSVTRGEPIAGAGLLVLYEPPGTPGELRAVIGERTSVVALAQPRQLEALRVLAAGGRVSPLTLSGPEARARGREEAVRAELRAALAEGAPAREILALEPLLAEFDGIELAAAALRLLERERERPGRREAPQAEPAAGTAPWTRVFVNVGSKDGATPRDLVGAMANEGKIPSDKIGKIEVRDTHSLVEIASDAAEHVVKSIQGIMIRGRQVAARLDREPARRESSRREPARRDRGDRPPRSGPGGFRRGGDERRESRPPRPPRRRDD